MTRRRTTATALLAAGAATAAAFALAGCGGGSKPAATTQAATEQTVKGATFSFAAPAAWKAAATDRGMRATGPGQGLLSVAVYKLVKKYDPKRFDAAAQELDGVAAKLATGRKGKVTARDTVTVAGIPSRTYRIAYALAGAPVEQQVTFVLRDTTEWLLVCRRAAADPDGDCARFLSTFALASR